MHKCSQETHDRCQNSALCHLCDGVRLYKNIIEEKIRKQKEREKRKQEEKNAVFRVHKAEKKEGMEFEKVVTKKWNDAYKRKEESAPLFRQSAKKTKIQKPRLGVELEEEREREASTAEQTPSIRLSSFQKQQPKQKPVVDAKRQANSGALWYAKGDIKTEHYLLECKERGTVNARGEKTISIPKSWLLKQEQEAFQENRPYWAIPFRYKNDDAIYIVKSFDQELEMYQEMRRLREELAEFKSHDKSNT